MKLYDILASMSASTRRSRASFNVGVALLMSTSMVALNAAAETNAPDISGVWQVTKYVSSIRTLDGKLPPLKPEALQIYRQNLVAHKSLRPKEDMSRCVPPGTPRAMWAPFPILILQTARKITFVHEYQHLLRHIYLNETLPAADDLDTTFMGTSVARWDGDTLVIETIGINEKTVLDKSGLPHSEATRVIERIRMIYNGKRLEDLITINDPETFTEPWSTRATLERKRGVHLKEYNCLLKYEEF